MRASVHALLNELIDYAGLFPPAKLPLDAALETYQRERKASPYRWMLGRFVCPATRLAELPQHPMERSLMRLTALGQPAASADQFLAQLNADLDLIRGLRRTWSDVALNVYEVALPKGSSPGDLPLASLPDLLGQAGLTGFLEVPRTPTWRSDLEQLTDVLHDLYHAHPHAGLGLKLRCGGLSADAFPGDADVAFFLERCRSAHLPWKATAGLHHPRRHWDASLSVWHHGFLNVFIAGILGAVHSLNEADLVTILSDRELTTLRCDEDRLTYGNWSCTTAQIVEQRRDYATTFGSCSFAEPTHDLVALGLLTA